MAKYGNKHFIQLPRKIFSQDYRSLSTNAKWLYAVLNELEHEYSDRSQSGAFFHSDKELSEFSGIKLTALKAAKKELVESGLVETWQSPLEADGKKSRRHITNYRIK